MAHNADIVSCVTGQLYMYSLGKYLFKYLDHFFFVWIACLTMNWFLKNLCSVLYVLVRRKIYNYFLPVCGLPFTASFKKYLLVDLIYLKCRERIRSLTCWFSPQIPLKVKVGLDWGQEPGTQSGECAIEGIWNWECSWDSSLETPRWDRTSLSSSSTTVPKGSCSLSWQYCLIHRRF